MSADETKKTYSVSFAFGEDVKKEFLAKNALAVMGLINEIDTKWSELGLNSKMDLILDFMICREKVLGMLKGSEDTYSEIARMKTRFDKVNKAEDYADRLFADIKALVDKTLESGQDVEPGALESLLEDHPVRNELESMEDHELLEMTLKIVALKTLDHKQEIIQRKRIDKKKNKIIKKPDGPADNTPAPSADDLKKHWSQ